MVRVENLRFQRLMTFRLAVLMVAVLTAAAVAACSAGDTPAASPTVSPTSTSTPVPLGNPLSPRFEGIDGIAVPVNFDWPREVETAEGKVTLQAPPQRIHTLSLGHDEIIVALAGANRMAGIGSFTANETYSNVAGQVAGLPRVGRDAEEVLGLEPDLVLASQFTSEDLVDAIKDAGVPVIRTSLESSSLGNIPNILFIGYILGQEAEAVELADQISARQVFIDQGVDGLTPVRALSLARFSSLNAAGAGSTEEGIIQAAGGINAAGDIDGHQTISIESIVEMNPDVILITQPIEGAEELQEELLNDPALADVPAIKNGKVVWADPKYFTTLSHWNVRGIEEAAKLFYPDAFADLEFSDFD
ncbi:MAG: ABC transporter substrate-binding protein [Dehalococcoidia bacterium]